jgi:hypothetical protein
MGRWMCFAAGAFAGAVQMGDKQATLGRAKSLLRHQRGSQRRSYRFTLSNNRAPAIPGHGPLHVISRVHDNRGAMRTQRELKARTSRFHSLGY